jgi:hypothetical protein
MLSALSVSPVRNKADEYVVGLKAALCVVLV